MDFDDVERRTKQNAWNGPERRHWSEEKHHDVCKENTVALKEYICLKLAPIKTAVNRQWGLAVVILVFILGGGIWTGVESYGNNVQSNDIEHIQTEHKEFKEDIIKRIDAVENRFNKRLDEKTAEILRAIEEKHK